MNEQEKLINAMINAMLEDENLTDTQKVHIVYLIMNLNGLRISRKLQEEDFEGDETHERLDSALSVFNFLIDMFEKIFNINTDEESEDDEECENEA